MKASKITMGLIVLALIGVMTLPVSAQEIKDTAVTATVSSTYELTIPAATDIAFNATSTPLKGTLKVIGNVQKGECVEVSATQGALHNSAQNADLPYTLMNGQGEYHTTSWSEDELRAGSKELKLYIDILEKDWNQAKAGNYAGTLTFTADLRSAS